MCANALTVAAVAVLVFGPTAMFLLLDYRLASAIEARRAETQGGSVEDESAVAESETPKPQSHQ